MDRELLILTARAVASILVGLNPDSHQGKMRDEIHALLAKFAAPDTGQPQGQSSEPEPVPSTAAAPPTQEKWEPWPNSYNPNNTTQLG